MLKKSLLAIAIAALATGAAAQTSITTNSDTSFSTSQGDTTFTSMVNLPGALPFTQNNLEYSGSYRVKGVPVNSAASSFSSPAVWRCATAGSGGALQFKDFAMSLALPGGVDDLCRREFRVAIVNSIFDRATKIEQMADKAGPDYALAREGLVASVRLMCGDEAMADSLEGSKLQCAENTFAESRKARWERERQQAAQRQALGADGKLYAVMPGVPAPNRRPNPWEAGG